MGGGRPCEEPFDDGAHAALGLCLTLTPDHNRWVGYRDTFEVDGNPVRDRDERLERLLRDGAVGQAARIAEQNAQFNLGQHLVYATSTSRRLRSR